MEPEARVRAAEQVEQRTEPAPARVVAESASVVLLRPRKLRGTIGIVRRRVATGWEVEIRSPAGTPMHLTLPEKALYVR